jgi:hypothetical protein
VTRERFDDTINTKVPIHRFFTSGLPSKRRVNIENVGPVKKHVNLSELLGPEEPGIFHFKKGWNSRA